MKRIQAFFVSIMWLHKTAFFYLLDTGQNGGEDVITAFVLK